MITLWWLALAATAWQGAGVRAVNKPFAAAEIGAVCTERSKLAAAAEACIFIAADAKDTARGAAVTAKLQGLALTAREVVRAAEATGNTTMEEGAKALASTVDKELRHAQTYTAQAMSTQQWALRIAVQLTHAAAEIKQFVTIAASLAGKHAAGGSGAPCIGTATGATNTATPTSQLDGAAATCTAKVETPVSPNAVVETLGTVKNTATVRFATSGNSGNVQDAAAQGECPLLNVAGASGTEPGAVKGESNNKIVYGNAITFKAANGQAISWKEDQTFRVGGEETTLSAVRTNVTALLALIDESTRPGHYEGTAKCAPGAASAIVCDRAQWHERLRALEERVAASADAQGLGQHTATNSKSTQQRRRGSASEQHGDQATRKNKQQASSNHWTGKVHKGRPRMEL
ncbi:hypothetical protein ERJ75_001711300 [Trypanosoma vivax]|uniref:Trypanosome variant surface glycoprotein A-type N-terminal domain-containing protein n=1 Tax=Trypanosoma vivax (strain Y486) TaxID=1055687 RepID=F9WW25_TRYVY|nr:hypothetical protein ERJ75_001711300 [Trypanosoma vivax]CCD21792.1 hypothetical protein, conserved in T. vivax [Trypanosoma vivax Y486]|eukprot:CCD21792.1 hypothetical protein, conserved in T. vivax [Trypanosoma vivax Y486]